MGDSKKRGAAGPGLTRDTRRVKADAGRSTPDCSSFSHGAFYHAFYDRHQAEARGLIIDMVPEGSSVLDIGSGTGELSFDLAARKNCRVVGIDLSRRMIEFAERRNRYSSVRFVPGDSTNLGPLGLGVFDCATVMFLLHELPRPAQVETLNQALAAAGRVIVMDSRVPLPWNAHGIGLRIVEVIGGRDHFRLFADYLSGGGLDGVLGDAGLARRIAERRVFWHGCREVVVLDGSRDGAAPEGMPGAGSS